MQREPKMQDYISSLRKRPGKQKSYRPVDSNQVLADPNARDDQSMVSEPYNKDFLRNRARNQKFITANPQLPQVNKALHRKNNTSSRQLEMYDKNKQNNTSLLPNISKNIGSNHSEYDVDPRTNSVIKKLPQLNVPKQFAEDSYQNRSIISQRPANQAVLDTTTNSSRAYQPGEFRNMRIVQNSATQRDTASRGHPDVQPKLHYQVKMKKSDLAILSSEVAEESVKQQIIYKLLKDKLSKIRTHHPSYQFEEQQNQKMAKLLNIDSPDNIRNGRVNLEPLPQYQVHSSQPITTVGNPIGGQNPGLQQRRPSQVSFTGTSDQMNTQTSFSQGPQSRFMNRLTKLPQLKQVSIEEKVKNMDKDRQNILSRSTNNPTLRKPRNHSDVQQVMKRVKDPLTSRNQPLRQLKVQSSKARFNSADSVSNLGSKKRSPSSKRPSPFRELSRREQEAVDILTNPRIRKNRYCPYCAEGIEHGIHYGQVPKRSRRKPAQQEQSKKRSLPPPQHHTPKKKSKKFVKRKRSQVEKMPMTYRSFHQLRKSDKNQMSQTSFLQKGADRLAYKRVRPQPKRVKSERQFTPPPAIEMVDKCIGDDDLSMFRRVRDQSIGSAVSSIRQIRNRGVSTRDDRRSNRDYMPQRLGNIMEGGESQKDYHTKKLGEQGHQDSIKDYKTQRIGSFPQIDSQKDYQNQKLGSMAKIDSHKDYQNQKLGSLGQIDSQRDYQNQKIGSLGMLDSNKDYQHQKVGSMGVLGNPSSKDLINQKLGSIGQRDSSRDYQNQRVGSMGIGQSSKDFQNQRVGSLGRRESSIDLLHQKVGSIGARSSSKDFRNQNLGSLGRRESSKDFQNQRIGSHIQESEREYQNERVGSIRQLDSERDFQNQKIGSFANFSSQRDLKNQGVAQSQILGESQKDYQNEKVGSLREKDSYVDLRNFGTLAAQGQNMSEIDMRNQQISGMIDILSQKELMNRHVSGDHYSSNKDMRNQALSGFIDNQDLDLKNQAISGDHYESLKELKNEQLSALLANYKSEQDLRNQAISGGVLSSNVEQRNQAISGGNPKSSYKELKNQMLSGANLQSSNKDLKNQGISADRQSSYKDFKNAAISGGFGNMGPYEHYNSERDLRNHAVSAAHLSSQKDLKNQALSGYYQESQKDMLNQAISGKLHVSSQREFKNQGLSGDGLSQERDLRHFGVGDHQSSSNHTEMRNRGVGSYHTYQTQKDLKNQTVSVLLQNDLSNVELRHQALSGMLDDNSSKQLQHQALSVLYQDESKKELKHQALSGILIRDDSIREMKNQALSGYKEQSDNKEFQNQALSGMEDEKSEKEFQNQALSGLFMPESIKEQRNEALSCFIRDESYKDIQNQALSGIFRTESAKDFENREVSAMFRPDSNKDLRNQALSCYQPASSYKEFCNQCLSGGQLFSDQVEVQNQELSAMKMGDSVKDMRNQSAGRGADSIPLQKDISISNMNIIVGDERSIQYTQMTPIHSNRNRGIQYSFNGTADQFFNIKKGIPQPIPGEHLCKNCHKEINGAPESRDGKDDEPQPKEIEQPVVPVEKPVQYFEPIEEEKKPVERPKTPEPEKEYMPFEGLTVDARMRTPEKELTDKSLSAMSLGRRDQDNQVSEGAFAKSITENFIQTGLELLENYPPSPKIEKRVIEIQTDPWQPRMPTPPPPREPTPPPPREPTPPPREPTPPPREPTPPRTPTPPKWEPDVAYDWAESKLFDFVDDKHKDLVRKNGGRRLDPNQVLHGINTPGDNPDADEEYFKELQDEYVNLNPNEEDIYTEIEATYKASLLKKKARSYNTQDALLEFHQKASRTIDVLTQNMILGDITLDRIFEICQDVTRENVIKLLLRCKKMYEARVDIKKILFEIIKKEDYFHGKHGVVDIIVQNEERNSILRQDEEILMEGLQIISRCLRYINQFRHEHKIFKGQFIFRKQDYVEALLNEAKELIDFMDSKGIKTPILKENGLLIPRDDEDAKNDVGNYVKRVSAFLPRSQLTLNRDQVDDKFRELTVPEDKLGNVPTYRRPSNMRKSMIEEEKNPHQQIDDFLGMSPQSREYKMRKSGKKYPEVRIEQSSESETDQRRQGGKINYDNMNRRRPSQNPQINSYGDSNSTRFKRGSLPNYESNNYSTPQTEQKNYGNKYNRGNTYKKY